MNMINVMSIIKEKLKNSSQKKREKLIFKTTFEKNKTCISIHKLAYGIFWRCLSLPALWIQPLK